MASWTMWRASNTTARSASACTSMRSSARSRNAACATARAARSSAHRVARDALRRAGRVRSAARICLLAALASCGSPDARVEDTRALAIRLPGGEGGIGFDDLRFSPQLDRILVPAGRTGNLDLVDPVSGEVEVIPGFGRRESYSGGHGDGATSVDQGRGLLVAVDRNSHQLRA